MKVRRQESSINWFVDRYDFLEYGNTSPGHPRPAAPLTFPDMPDNKIRV